MVPLVGKARVACSWQALSPAALKCSVSWSNPFWFIEFPALYEGIFTDAIVCRCSTIGQSVIDAGSGPHVCGKPPLVQEHSLF